MAFALSGTPLTLTQLEEILDKRLMLEIPADVLAAVALGKTVLDQDQVTIAQDYLAVHAVGFGPEIPEEIIRLAFIIHLQTLISQKQPDIQPITLNRLLAFFNRDIYPLVLQQGTSTAQLSQLILPLMGVGKVKYQGYELNAVDILDIFSWEPLKLHPAEVTALLHGETFPLAYSAYNLLKAYGYIAWVSYLATVFTQIASANPDEISSRAMKLQNAFELAQNAFVKSQEITAEANGTETLCSKISDLIIQLQSCLGTLAKYTDETFENLISTSEPPATVSFKQALNLTYLLQYQLNQILVNSSAARTSSMQLQLVNSSLANLIALTEQITALAFWSVSQVGKVFNLASENLTLAAYYHSDLFVPKEMVSTQLEKIISFIRTDFPTSEA